MRTIVGETNDYVIRQSCLATQPDGSTVLYPSFEDVYRAQRKDDTLQMVYCAIDKATGEPAKGFQPWYNNLCQLFKQMQSNTEK